MREAKNDYTVPKALLYSMREGWSTPKSPPFVVDPIYQTRRDELRAQYPERIMLFASGSSQVRSNDTFFRFRADSDFLYLVGMPLEGAFLEVAPNGDRLYVPEVASPGTDEYWLDRDAGGLWVGAHLGHSEIAAATGIEVLPIPGSLPKVEGEQMLESRAFLSEARLVKDPFEIQEIKKAVAATLVGFDHLAGELAHGASEAWLEGTFSRVARSWGYDNGYLPIVGSGENACVLHWMRNSGVCKDGDLVLVDAGVETTSGYTADVTRTFPVSGRYTAVQKEVYCAVEKARKAAVAQVRAGASFKDPHQAATRVLAEFLIDARLVEGSLQEVLETQTYRRYTLHGTSHMLGLDVHDCANADVEKYQGTLMENMVLTIEPGLYFQPNDDTVPVELRGIGIRIEDDVRVTAAGCENLTIDLPTDAVEVEAWLEQRRSSRRS